MRETLGQGLDILRSSVVHLLRAKRCHNYNHTLLQKEVDTKKEWTKEVTKDVTYVAPSKSSEEVLFESRSLLLMATLHRPEPC